MKDLVTVVEHDGSEWVITDTCSNYVFNVVRAGSVDIRCGTEANAHLIAAAPEMYAMLKLAISLMDCDSIEVFMSQYQEISTLLSKARGEP